MLAQNPAQLMTELQKVITSWPLLPEQVKKQILSLIEANIQKETKTIENNSKF
jgi:hypothetical protein